MRKVLKIFLNVLIVAILVVPTVISVSAKETRVFDDAGLFTAHEKDELEDKIDDLKDDYEHDFVIVTTTDTGGRSIESYADDYYNYNDFGVGSDNSGTMLLIDIGSRGYDIYRLGEIKEYVKDKDSKKIAKKVENKLKENDYYNASNLFLDEMEKEIENGKYELTSFEILIAILIALVVGGIIVGVVVYKYSFAGKQSPYPLKENSKLNLTRREDVFVNKTVTHVRIQSSNSRSSGGSRGGGSHNSGSF